MSTRDALTTQKTRALPVFAQNLPRQIQRPADQDARRRIVAVHSSPGDRLLDFFAGSGTFGEAAASLGRDVVLVDRSPAAIDVMRRRLGDFSPRFHDVPAAEAPAPR